MEVRVCPSCGTENKKSRSTCANCYASLANVPATQSAAGAQPAAPQGRTLSGAPMQSGGAQPAGSHVGTQPRPQAPPPGVPPTRAGGGLQPPYSSSEPASGGSLAWLFILMGVLLAIGAVAFVGLQLRPIVKAVVVEPKVPADKVVTGFLEAKKTRDIAKIKPFLSKESIQTLETAFSSKQMQSAGFSSEDANKMYLWDVSPTPRQLSLADYTVKPVVKKEAAEKRMRVIRVSLTPTQSAQQSVDTGDQAALMTMDSEVDFYLVVEDAEWKIDLKETSSNASQKPLALPK